MSSERNINIHIKSVQSDASGERNEIEFYTEGKYIEKSGSRYITYKESEVSGMEGTTSMIRISEDEVSLLRFGRSSAKFNFRQGSKTETEYETPYGVISMKVNTQEVFVDMQEKARSTVMLRYILEIQGQAAMQNELVLSFI